MDDISNYIMYYLFITLMISLFVHLFFESLDAKGLHISRMRRLILGGVLILAFVL